MKLLCSAALVIFSIHAGLAQRNIATFSSITATQALDGKVFFAAAHDLYGTELFVSDGTSGNFRLLKDISPGSGGSSPSQFTVFNNQLFFIAYSPTVGQSLWKSDGTAEGTQLVYGVNNAEPSNLMVFKGKLYFTTYLGSIMRTDGTAGGTEVFYQADFTWGRIMTVVKDDDYIYFTSGGRTIYRDDGFSRIDFLGPLSWEDVYFKNLFVLENTLVAIKSSTYDNVVRVYSLSKDVLGDQEEDEWLLIKKLDAPLYGSQELDNFTNVSGKMFFSFRSYYDNVQPADELWVCDGTEAGTKMVKSFRWDPHYYKSEMGMFFPFNGKLFFRGGIAQNRSLWTSDGTTAGTIKFHDVVLTAPYNDERTPVLVAEDKIYFSGDEHNAELWSSDGTVAATRQLLDVEDAGGSTPHDLTISNNVVYFVSSQQFSATLWSTMPAGDISVTGIKSGEKPYLFYAATMGTCKTSNVVIRNKGLGELYLGNIFLTGTDFYLVQQSLPEALAPGESVTLQVVFNPVKEGTARATLTILSSDFDEPNYVIYLEASPTTSATTELCQFPESGYVKSLEPGEITKPIVLSNSSIAEGQPQGTVIGELSLPGTPGNVTYTFVTGEGDLDNQHFSIDGNLLRSTTVFNFNLKSVYSIRVKATSGSGETETSLRIRVGNASAGFVDGGCQLTFELMNFAYTSLEANQEGHLFATTSNGQILRSMDAGHHWEVVYAGVGYNYSTLSGITFKGNTGFVQGSNIILKSEDGGATWFNLYMPLSGEYYFNTLGAFFLSDTKGYAGTENGEIFFTDDGGRTWDIRLKQSWYEFRDLFFVSEDKGYATVDWGDMVQTVDGGRTWSAIDLSALGWNPRVRDFWFINDNDGFLITEYKFYATSNGGQTWVEVPGIYGGDVARIKFYDENVGFLYAGNAIMYKTTNGGDTWDQLFPGVSPGSIIGVAQSSGKIFIASRNYYYSDEWARSLAVSSDEGATWSTLNYLSAGSLYHIDFSIERKGIVIGEDGLFKTEDNGLTWKQASMGLASVADVHFIDENTVILLSGGHLYKSTDGGATTRNVLTTEQGDPYVPAGKLFAFSGDILFSVSWYAVYRSDDLGETWDLVSTDPGYYTQGMHFISSSIGYRIELFGSVEKTSDGGRTWSSVFTREPTASDVFNAIFFLNENVGYSGGDYLRRTTNGGESWETVDWPFYEIIAIHFENEAHGYVVTRGGTVYETSDAGATWQTIFTASLRIYEVQFTNNEIYLAGEKGFVARMNTTPVAPALPGYIYGPDRVCAGDATQYYVSVNGNYGTQWSTTAGNVEDHNGSVTVSFPEPGEYTVTAKHFNSCGVSETRTTTVLVSSPTEAPVIEGPSPVKAGEQDVAYTVVNGNEDSQFLWEVEGSATTSPVENGVVVDWASSAENGEVKVLAVDAAGCRTYGALVVTVEVPLAAEADLHRQVNIYPNPAETDTHIASSYGRLLFVRIMDALGREYSRITLSRGEDRTMLTRQLPAGLYLVEISDGIHTVTKKLIRK